MNRLIRAEWYRVSKTYHLLWWTIGFVLFVTYVALMNVGFDSAESGMNAFNMFMETGMIMILYMPLFVGGMYVSSYENKTLTYEIMAGNKPGKIILSKLITIVPLLFVIVSVFVFSPLVIFGQKNGYGDTKQLPLIIIVCTITLLRVLVSAVLMMTTFKSTIGMFLVVLRFLIFEGVGLVAAEMLAGESEIFEKVSACLVQGAVSLVMSPMLDKSYVIVIVITSVVEMVVWYVLSYNSYKKKWFG